MRCKAKLSNGIFFKTLSVHHIYYIIEDYKFWNFFKAGLVVSLKYVEKVEQQLN